MFAEAVVVRHALTMCFTQVIVGEYLHECTSNYLVYTQLVTSIRSRSFIAIRASYWFDIYEKHKGRAECAPPPPSCGLKSAAKWSKRERKFYWLQCWHLRQVVSNVSGSIM